MHRSSLKNWRSTRSRSRTTSWSRWTACAAFRLPANAPLPVPSKKSPTCCTRNPSASSAFPPSAGISGGSSLKTSSTPVLTATNSSSSVTAKTTPAGCAACRTSVRFLIRWICSSSPSERNRFRLWWMKSLKTTPRTASCSSPAASVKRKKAGK